MKSRLRFSYAQIISFGFIAVILIGAFLLCLPVSNRAGEWMPYTDALFTATSATCVTGLVVFDTYLHWSIFGQIVILFLIQIGGLGFMTIIALVMLLFKRKISLRERMLLMQTAGSTQVGGMVDLIRRIALGTFALEGLGTIIFTIRFLPKMGFLRALWNAVFLAVSSFCNAGFDICGEYGEFSSLARYANDSVVLLTVCGLIIIGGIGFIVWRDVATKGFKFSLYELHTKLVLVTTAVLILGGTILFRIAENNNFLEGMNGWEKFTSSLFLAVSPRTAGFSIFDLSRSSEAGKIFTEILMFIGGSPGSTAGGIKTTTFIVMLIGIYSSVRHISSPGAFKHRFEEGVVGRAYAIAGIYLLMIFVSTILICIVQPELALDTVLFEVVSAAGTSGLSLGITTTLCTVSRLIITLLMFTGRIGGLTLALSLAEKREVVPVNRPAERILIG